MPNYDKLPYSPSFRLGGSATVDGATITGLELIDEKERQLRAVREAREGRWSGASSEGDAEGGPMAATRSAAFEGVLEQVADEFDAERSGLDLLVDGRPTDPEERVRVRVPADRYPDADWLVVDDPAGVTAYALPPGETEYELLLRIQSGTRQVATLKRKDPSLLDRMAARVGELLDRLDASGRQRRGLDRVAVPAWVPQLVPAGGPPLPLAFPMSTPGPAPGSLGNAAGNAVDAAVAALPFRVACHLSQPLLFRTRVRTFTPANHDELLLNTAEVLDASSDWSRYDSSGSEQRVLLLLHGTGMQAHLGFDGLASKPDGAARTLLRDLHEHYGGRILAFDHQTLSETPLRNIERLLERIPAGVKLVLDLIGVSRGCALARLLAEGYAAMLSPSRALEVKRAVLVAAPNEGTPMGTGLSSALCLRQVRCHRAGDAGHLIDLAGLVPSGSWGGERLHALTPGVAFLAENSPETRRMNGHRGTLPTVTGQPVYYRVASHYGVWDDSVSCAQTHFAGPNNGVRPNDLVVPRGPALQPDLVADWDTYAGRADMFRDLSAHKLSLAPADRVTHVDYFGQAKVHQALRGWLLNNPVPGLPLPPGTV